MKTEEWQNLQTLMETWEKRRKHLGEFDANAADILALGQVVLTITRGLTAEATEAERARGWLKALQAEEPNKDFEPGQTKVIYPK